MQTLHGDAFFTWVLQTSWQAAVLACLILGVQWLFRKRLSAGWRYSLWSLLLVRLLLPFSPQSTFSIFRLAHLNPQGRAVELVRTSTPVPSSSTPTVFVPLAMPRPETKPADLTPVGLATVPASPPTATPKATVSWRASLWPAAFGIWVLGMGILGFRLVWTNLRFLLRIRSHGAVSDPELLRTFAECLGVYKLKQRVTLLETSCVDSPAVYGFWRKRLVLPHGIRQRFSPRELRFVFLHELAHIKRRDLEINWLTSLLQVLHWFNPVLWLAFARMRVDREVATDALAVSRAGHAERTGYGETIIKLAEWLAGPKASPALVGIAEGKAEIKRRITMIARIHGTKSWPVIPVALLAVLAVVTCPDSPAPEPSPPAPRDPLGESGVSPQASKLIATLKQATRWTFGPKAMFFGDEDGEVSAGLVRSAELRSYAMSAQELAGLGGPSAAGLPKASSPTDSIQWDFQKSLKSTDGRVTLLPMATTPATAPDFAFVETDITSDNTTALRFSAGTCFEVSNPFKDPSGSPYIVDYTLIMDVMFPTMPSRWAALWQTDPKNQSDAEWFISTEKGIGITDTYAGHIEPGEWHRVALVLRGSDAVFLSFVDGKEVQRKYLDVKDEFFNRRRDEDVVNWADTFSKLRNLEDPSATTAVAKFNLRLENSLRRFREAEAPAHVPPQPSIGPVDQVASAKAWAALVPTPQLASTLALKSRWTLGPKALLFADENGENAGGLVNALQLRNYAMTDDEVAATGGPGVDLPQPPVPPAGTQIVQWDFHGNLDSSSDGSPLVPRACPPATEPEFSFLPFNASDSTAEAARFSRGTCFEVVTGLSSSDGRPYLLNYSVIMDVKIEERPVGWVSLWQNDVGNHTDADWFINKKKQLGIRDLYGGLVEDDTWNRLALVVDGKNGTLTHFVNGRKVRTKLMILEDDYARRGGGEPSLDFLIGVIAALAERNDPQAAELVQYFTRRMHNHPDPESTYRFVPLDVEVLDESERSPVPGALVLYQMGESSEDFFPESMTADASGRCQIKVPIPVADRVHVTARAPGYSWDSGVVPGPDLLAGSRKKVQLTLLRGLKIGGKVVLGDNATPVPNAQVQLLADRPEASAPEVRAWDRLVAGNQDGAWSADFIPVDVQHLTIVVYHPAYQPQTFVVNRSDSAFQDLKELKAIFELKPEVKHAQQ